MAGLYAIYNGKVFFNHQEKVIEKLHQLTKAGIDSIHVRMQADTLTGNHRERRINVQNPYMADYTFLTEYAIKKPAPLAFMALGVSDLQPYYIKIDSRNLGLQLFTTEIRNPGRLLLGNFDLSFVIIWLFPLYIIALSFDVLSREKENGTLKILVAQGMNIRHFIRYQLIFRLLVISVPLLLLMTAVLAVSKMPVLTLPAVSWLFLVSILYFVFWFSIIYLLCSFQRNSKENALLLSLIWVFLLVLLPSLLNLSLNKAVPYPEPGKIQRSARHVIDDPTPTGLLLKDYIDRHPQIRDKDTANMHWRNYKRYFLVLEKRNTIEAPLFQENHERMQRRLSLEKWLRILSPASIQSLFDEQAENSIQTYEQFTRDIKNYHKRRSAFVAKRLFNDQPMNSADFARFPRFISRKTATDFPLAAVFMLLWTAGIVLWAEKRSKYTGI